MANIAKLWKLVISTSLKSNIRDDAMKASRSNVSSSLAVKTYLSLLHLLFSMAICDSRCIEVQRQIGLLVENVKNVQFKDNLNLISFTVWSKENKNMC